MRHPHSPTRGVGNGKAGHDGPRRIVAARQKAARTERRKARTR